MLIITIMFLLSPDGSEWVRLDPYGSAMACGNALLDVSLAPGWSAHCEATGLLSASPRPVARGD